MRIEVCVSFGHPEDLYKVALGLEVKAVRGAEPIDTLDLLVPPAH
jgi:hypothetical protein